MVKSTSLGSLKKEAPFISIIEIHWSTWPGKNITSRTYRTRKVSITVKVSTVAVFGSSRYIRIRLPPSMINVGLKYLSRPKMYIHPFCKHFKASGVSRGSGERLASQFQWISNFWPVARMSCLHAWRNFSHSRSLKLGGSTSLRSFNTWCLIATSWETSNSLKVFQHWNTDRLVKSFSLQETW